MNSRLFGPTLLLTLLTAVAAPALQSQVPEAPLAVGPSSFLALSAVWAAAQDIQPALQAQPGPNRAKGALWGGAIGLVAGGVLGAISVESEEPDGFGGSLVDSAATSTAVILGGLFGAAVGALLGATVFAPSGS